MIVAFEGIDGSGKTTQIRNFVASASGYKKEVKVVRTSRFLVELITRESRDDFRYSPRKRSTNNLTNTKSSIFELFLIVVYIYITHFILRLYSLKYLVICDRYFWQLIYDVSGSSGIGLFRFLPSADLYIYLRIPVSALSSRLDAQDQVVSRAYYEDVKKFMESIFLLKKKCFEFDATLNVDILAKSIQDLFNEKCQK